VPSFPRGRGLSSDDRDEPPRLPPDPDATMPDLILTPEETDNIIACILSLKGG
jgi:hypothetical protein